MTRALLLLLALAGCTTSLPPLPPAGPPALTISLDQCDERGRPAVWRGAASGPPHAYLGDCLDLYRGDLWVGELRINGEGVGEHAPR